ncbi:MAG TPA: plasmid pRiA4b ORF-3 family protein [Acetobacteraceae bacterium]|nr:plasmid pRiA4b ORF-3 family protein [Acetobacteraceae bacterium]
MTRPPEYLEPATDPNPPAPDGGGGGAVQLKIWLQEISPMVWRRLLVPGTCTLRELHGVIQVAMGWEGIHLFRFRLRAARHGSRELSASSPDVTLAALRLRRGARFTYEYDLNVPWRHELRVEDHLAAEPGKAYPFCTGGGGACPPEDCGGPEGYFAGLDEARSLDAVGDLDTMAKILRKVVLERRPEVLDDDETRWRLEEAVARSRARERARGRPFSRRSVNARLRDGEHRELMHQQC